MTTDRVAGLHEGPMWISNDFDEPLPDEFWMGEARLSGSVMVSEDTVTIRLAIRDDLDALCRLYYDFHEFHVRGVPDRLLSLGEWEKYDHAPLKAKLTELIEDYDAAIFVADSQGQIAGLVEMYLRQDESNPVTVTQTYGYLQSLMVQEKYWQSGIGRQLVQAAESWAKANDASEIRLDTWEFSAGPLAFYETIGYRTLRRTLVREL